MRLTGSELKWAVQVALRMRAKSVGDSRNTSFGTNEGTEQDAHLIGAIGECAWCKYFRVRWPAHIDRFKGSDVGERVQIRTRSEAWHDLRVKPGDEPSHAYFLAIFEDPNIVNLKGWKWGYEAHFYKAQDLEIRGSREKRNKPVHLVPQFDLYDLDSIPKDVLAECTGKFEVPSGV